MRKWIELYGAFVAGVILCGAGAWLLYYRQTTVPTDEPDAEQYQ